MKKRPIDYIRKKSARASGRERIGVLVDLTEVPDSDCLDRLRDLGLTIEKRVGKRKLVGTIREEDLEPLRSDEAVREVEVSVKLRPHRKRKP